MNQWVRLLEIDRRVRAGEYPNAPSLATEWEVTERLIFRDRTRLLQMGAPIKWDAKRGGWFYSDPTWILPNVRLSEGEMVAFFLLVEIARSGGNPGLQDLLLGAANKIAGNLSEQVSLDLSALHTSTSFGSSPAARVDAQVCLDLQKACKMLQKVRMRYFTISRGEWNWRVVHPYHLHFVRGEWILIAWDENRGKVLSFNIARIAHLETRTQKFSVQAGFDAGEFVRSMFFAEAGTDVFDIKVRFDAYQARFIREREWHPDQQRQDHDDGGATLLFPAGGLPEVARWVLGFGRHAKVLEPPELVTLVRAHVGELAREYELDASPHPGKSC